MTRVVQPSLGPRVFVDESDVHTPTLQWRITDLCDDADRIELELRGLIAAAHAARSVHAAARVRVITTYVSGERRQDWCWSIPNLLAGFTRENERLLEESRLEYECAELGLDEATRRVVREEARR